MLLSPRSFLHGAIMSYLKRGGGFEEEEEEEEDFEKEEESHLIILEKCSLIAC